MTEDIRSSVVPFSLNDLWAIEPSAFERLRDLVMSSSHERLAAAASLSATGPAGPGYENRAGVAVIPFAGVVTKRPTIWSEIFGGSAVTQDAMAAVDAAVADPGVKQILMVIDSPGGTVDGTADLADAVYEANKTKPVTAYGQDMMASAAYWVGSQAGRLVGNQTGAYGSIGVFSTIPDVSRLVKNLGIEMNVVKSVNGKGAGTLGAPVTESQLAEVQRLVDATHQLFVGAVSRGRGKNMSEVADGRVHIGQSAVDNGLLDAIEPLSTTLSKMQEEIKMAESVPVVTNTSTTTGNGDSLVSGTTTGMFLTGNALPAQPIPGTYTFGVVPPPVDHTAELAALRSKIEALETDKLIAGADPRKLTPGLVPVARKIAESGGAVALKDFLAALPTNAPEGGSVQDEKRAPALPEPRHAADHVGIALHAYNQKNAPVHQMAIAYMEKANLAGRKVTYREAVNAVTRKVA